MKKWVVIVAVVLVGIFVLKSTRMASYGRVMLEKAQAKWNKAIPPEIEIESLRGDIVRMDNDIRKTLRPLAEKIVTVEQEEQAIKTTEANLTREREELVQLRNEVATSTQRLSFRHASLTLDQAKRKLNNEVSIYDSRKANLESRKRRLDALRTSVAATQEQLNQLMEQKRNFEEQLNQIVADLEVQKLNEIARPLPMDNTKVSGINERLSRLRQELRVRQQERDLHSQWEPKLNVNAPTAPAATAQPVDLNRIDNVLGIQNPEGSKVAVGGGSNP
jgi:chromosome segregation ATPase